MAPTELMNAMRARGLEPPDHLAPGKITRFPTNGRSGDRSGWCRMFEDQQGAIFGDWRGGWQETWQASRDKPMSAAEVGEWKAKIAKAKKDADAEHAKTHAEAAKRALAEWNAAGPADPRHGYLAAKGVQPFGARQNARGQLLVSVHGPDGALQSLQKIWIAEGGKPIKQNYPDAKMQGGRYWLQQPGDDTAPVLLGEGFATMASIAEAIPGAAVACAFSAGNLKSVAEDIKRQHSGRRIILAGDNDESGVGQEKAREAAQTVGGSVAMPPETGDWNDVHQRDGLAAVQQGIEAAMAETSPQGRPDLLLDEGRWPEALATAINVLARSGEVFGYGGTMVAIDKDGRTFPVTAPWLCTIVERQFRVQKFDKRSADYVPARIPLEFAQRILAMRESWSFPRLEGVARHRVLRDDGTTIGTHGHDRRTGIYLHAPDPQWAPIPGDLREAVRTLWYPLSMMPFASPADAGAALALLLTAVQRPALPLAPMFIVSAPAFSSGKTLVGEVASLLADSDGSATVVGRQEGEQEKAIFAALLSGRSCLLLDNVSGAVGGDHLAAALTARRYRGRVLGQSAEAEAPTRVLWVATGVNIHPTADLVRRTLTIKVDPGVERPELRGFPFHPTTWTREHLAQMQAAALTILRTARSVDKGRLGSYEEWDRQVRQAVLTVIADGAAPCEMTDPLETITRERGNDPEVERLAALLHGWHAIAGERLITAADLVARASSGTDADGLRATLDEIAGDGRGHVNARKLGWYLRRHEGKIVEGLTVRKGVEGRLGVTWRVIPAGFSGFSDDFLNPMGNCQSDTYKEGCGNEPKNPRNPQPCPRCDGEGCSYCHEGALH